MEVLDEGTLVAICRKIENQRNLTEEMNSMFHEFNSQRQTGENCDVVIKSQGRCIPAHKLILSAVSKYFKTLFTSSIGQKDVSNLDEFSSSTVQFFIDLIYKSDLIPSNLNLSELIKLLDYVQATFIMDKLVDSIREVVNVENCFTLVKISFENRLALNMKTVLKSFVTDHFNNLKCSFNEKIELVDLFQDDAQEHHDVFVLCSPSISSTLNHSFALIDFVGKSCIERRNWFRFNDVLSPSDYRVVLHIFAFKRELYLASTQFEDDQILYIHKFNQCLQVFEKFCQFSSHCLSNGDVRDNDNFHLISGVRSNGNGDTLFVVASSTDYDLVYMFVDFYHKRTHRMIRNTDPGQWTIIYSQHSRSLLISKVLNKIYKFDHLLRRTKIKAAFLHRDGILCSGCLEELKGDISSRHISVYQWMFTFIEVNTLKIS